jgi:hypothetical protein
MAVWSFSDEETCKWFIKLHWRCYENEHPEFMTYYLSRYGTDAQLKFKTEIARMHFSREMTKISCEHITQLERFGDWLPQTVHRRLVNKITACSLCGSQYCPGFSNKGEDT